MANGRNGIGRDANAHRILRHLPRDLQTVSNHIEHRKATLHPMNAEAHRPTFHGHAYREAMAQDEIESASLANVPMLMAAVCALAAPLVLVAIIGFGGNLGVLGLLRFLAP